MIARLLAFLAILYVLGFAFFAVTLGGPAPDDATVRQWIDEHREEKYGK